MATGLTEFAAGFDITQAERGIVATRVFHFDPDSNINLSVDLPKCGEALILPYQLNQSPSNYPASFSSASNNILCRTLKKTPLQGHPSKFQWTATYSNEPVDPNVFTDGYASWTPSDVTKLSQSYEYGGEFTSITPNPDNTTDWLWDADPSKPVLQPIGFKVAVITRRFTKYLIDGIPYQEFKANVKKLAGTLNTTSDPFNDTTDIGYGNWLFLAAPTEPFRNCNDILMWRAELEFKYRNPDDSINDGWQKLLNLDGTWGIPTRTGGIKLYKYGNFDALFNETLPANITDQAIGP